MITSPIPIFPLGLVLFPGAAVPLHLFEPRYRAMLRDVSTTTQRFGLIAPPPDTLEANLPAGRIGCIAEITALETLPDGRANIIVEGREPFRFETYLDVGTEYRIAHIDDWHDLDDEPVALGLAADTLRSLAHRALVASMTLHDIDEALPELGDDPATLSFEVAQLMHLDDDVQYNLLADRSPTSRLQQMERVLIETLPELEEAAARHRLSRPERDEDSGPVAD